MVLVQENINISTATEKSRSLHRWGCPPDGALIKAGIVAAGRGAKKAWTLNLVVAVPGEETIGVF